MTPKEDSIEGSEVTIGQLKIENSTVKPEIHMEKQPTKFLTQQKNEKVPEYCIKESGLETADSTYSIKSRKETVTRNGLGKAQNSCQTEKTDDIELYRKALHLQQTGKHYEAVDSYQKLLVNIHPAASLYSNLGSAYFSLGDFIEARNAFDHALLIDPNYVKAVYNRALLYLAMNEKRYALLEFQHLLEIDPNNPKADRMICLLQASPN